MGRELYETEPLFREIVDQCAVILKPEIGADLRKILYPAAGQEAEAEKLIVQTRITQPALFVTEYALARLWMSWGIQPAAMIGHSVGEYVAACLAGVFPLADGLKLIATRGRLIQEQPAGSMLAVMCPVADVTPLLPAGVTIAAINAPSLCVASGPQAGIEELERALAAKNLTARRLLTSHAFHSEMMQPVVAPFEAVLRKVAFEAPRIPYVSNVTGQWVTAEQSGSPDYWTRHLRHAVHFSDGMSLLMTKGEQVFLEVGPGAALTSLATQHVGKSTNLVAPSLAGDRDQTSELAHLLGALGRLWQAGVEIDWKAFYAQEKRRRVPLPTYPFESKRYFIEPGQVAVPAPSAPAAAVLPVSPAEAVATETTAPSSVAAGTREQKVAARVLDVMQSLSGLAAEDLDAEATFLQMGFDSLFLSQLSRALEGEFGLPISFRELTSSFPTRNALTRHFTANSPRNFDAPPAAAPRAVAAVAAAPTSAPVAQGDLATVMAQIAQLSRQVERLTAALQPARDVTLQLSEAQQEIWLASQLGEDTSRTYNESYLLHLDGALDVARLRESLQVLVDRRDALRAVFGEDGSSQKIRARVDVELPVLPVTESGFAAGVRQQLDAVFDLAAGPLFRFRLFRLEPQRHALLLVVHHIVADGWSWGLMLEEIGANYSALSRGDAPPERAAAQYGAYVEWLDGAEHRIRVVRDEEYWVAKLADEPAEVDLPADRPRPPRKTYRSGHFVHRFAPAVSGRLREAAQARNATAFHMLMASFSAWLHRITSKSDLVIGVPMAGQAAAGLPETLQAAKLVGHCVNMLPLRVECAGQDSFEALLARVRDNLFDAVEHQNVSLGKLIERLKRPHDPSRAPLVSVSLNLARQPRVEFEGARVRAQLPPKAYSYFDLTVDVVEGADGFVIEAKYNADLFEDRTIERWIGQWERLLASAIARPGARVADLDLLSDEEAHRLHVEWNATARDFPRTARLPDLIAQQVAAVPDKPAVVCGDQTLSYRELDRRSTQLARHLVELGVGPDVLVGVCLERSAEMVVAFLGILKAGGAYVPLDPAHPRDRIQYVLEDAGAPVLLTQLSLESTLVTGARKVCLDRDAGLMARMDTAPLTARHDPKTLAYVIYTSGSTGKPKGVQIEHHALVNFMNSMRREPGMAASDVLLAVTTPTFDIAGLEMFLPLVCGATVVVAPQDALIDGSALVRLVDQHRITVMQATPATWRLMLGAGWQGSKDLSILCGGEPLPGDLAASLLTRCKALWNVYGPTETTIWSTVSQVRDAADIHIGHPIDNTQIRIVDAHLNSVPVGVPGELLIGGDGLARGYFKRAELTAEKFIRLPKDGATFYRTGDLARYRADGNIQCLGRLDFQVKVRGFRIELGEIETAMTAAPGVRQAVVVARPDHSGTTVLVAYFVSQPAQDLAVPELREHLRRSLPEYMVPTHFVKLEALPLTPNGKIDRKPLLAQPIVTTDAPALVEPRTPSEKLVASLFKEVLNVKAVGADDDFFSLGGHSLMAARLMSRMRAVSGHDVPLRNLFDHSTVSALARVLDALSWSAGGAARAGAEPGREVFEI